MSRQNHIKKLLIQHNRRLQVLKEQQARYGLETPASILIEIGDIEAEIEQLQNELKPLNTNNVDINYGDVLSQETVERRRLLSSRFTGIIVALVVILVGLGAYLIWVGFLWSNSKVSSQQLNVVNTSERSIPDSNSLSGEILYWEQDVWKLKNLANDTSQIILLPEEGIESLTWSPDGDFILFSWQGPDDKFTELYLFRFDDGSISKFFSLPDQHLLQPAWSPDGKLIAFLAAPKIDVPDPVAEIYLVDKDGKQLNKLTDQGRAGFGPTWSPDSKKIAYFSKPTPNGVYRIFIMDRNGNNNQQISFGDSGGDVYPDWSPDGQQIAFHSFRENIQGIWRLNLSSDEIQQIAPSHKFAVRPLWSPNGKWIAFVSRPEDLDGPGDIFITNLDETILYKLTSTSSTWFRHVSWRPNIN